VGLDDAAAVRHAGVASAGLAGLGVEPGERVAILLPNDPIDSALLVAGVAEVHQLPDRVVLVGLDQLTSAIP
jgi:hypothetical protein